MTQQSDLEKRKISVQSLWNGIKSMSRLWPFFEGQKKWIVVSLALVPVIALLAATPAILLKYIIDDGMLGRNEAALWQGASLYLGMVILNYISQVGQSFASGIAVQHMVTNLRSKLVGHVLKLPSRFHDRNMSGALVTRATGDFENLAQSLNQGILTSVADLARLIGILAGMFYLSWEFGVIATLVIAFGTKVMGYFSSRLRTAMLESRKHSSEMNAFAQEILTNSITVKLISAEGAAARRFDQLNERNRKSLMREVVYDANLYSFLDGISAICIGAALYYVISQHSGADRYTAGTLVAFVQYMFQVFEPLKMLGNKIAMLQGVFTAIERIFGVLDVTDTLEGSKVAPQFGGRIEASNLVFAYTDADDAPRILNNVHFAIERGQSLAIVGRTGSGKSTIVRLLSKTYDRYKGSLCIDGQEVRDLTSDSVQRQMAIVSQDISLFNDSIFFNVAMGRPEIGLEEVQAACLLAGANRFIEKLPGTYDFVVSEKGENLSQGQRQLISLARALVHKPSILMLDEATSSIDPESEQIFQSAVERILGHCTVIIIAHRLQTIAKCDRVLVLENGSVSEFGSYADLVAQEGAFHKLKYALADAASPA
jgi:ATP-binding cassette subfamily B multidrug efflux pump